MLDTDLGLALQGGQGPRRLLQHQIGAMPGDIVLPAEFTDEAAQGLADPYPGQKRPPLHDVVRQTLALLSVLLGKGGTVMVKGLTPQHQFNPQLRIPGPGHLQAETEAIEQLRTQLALFRIHRAHQDEAGGMTIGDALALDAVFAAGGRIQDQVDDVVIEQVDLVDVEQATVGGGEQAR